MFLTRKYTKTNVSVWVQRECSYLTVTSLVDIARNFDILLTVKFSIFILAINQLDAQNLFYNKFISCLYMFRALCAHHQEVKIVLYSIWYHHTL